MKDYTEIFAAALRQSEGYSADAVQSALNAYDTIFCTDDMDCLYENFLFLYETDGWNHGALYGYLSVYHPLALLTEHCPAFVKEVLQQQHILFTSLEEPMCCDAEILRQYAPQPAYIIFNEDALISGNPSPDDAHFRLVLQRLETGCQPYVDAGNFRFCEINR